MTSPSTPTDNVPQPARRSSLVLPSLLILCVFLLLAVLTVWRTSPPPAVPVTAPDTEFASARAMAHLEPIAREVHPTGSPGHDRVRDYLTEQISALGLTPEIQRTTAVYQMPQVTYDRTGTVQNILTRIPGSDPTGQAVLLIAHYDSSISSFGANRDGTGVAALLETMRALRAGPAPKQDILFLFTDATEAYMLGAKAFADEHPWAREVGVAFNFDARGSGGPAVLFETSANNSWLVREFAEAAPHPFGNSLLTPLYALFGFYSDLTLVKQQLDVPGLNFAYADELQHYHSAIDSVEHVDERSLQHQGEYALSLARHFGNLDLSAAKSTGNSIYFNLFGDLLIRYPQSFALPLAVITLLLGGALLVSAVRKKLATVKGVLGGSLIFLLSLAVAAVVPMLVKMGLTAVVDAYALTNHDELYLIAFTALTVAAVSAVYAGLGKKRTLPNLILGAVLVWLLPMMASAFLLPGGSYLFTLPLLIALPGLWLVIKQQDRPLPGSRLAIIALTLLPALLLITQAVHLLFILAGHDYPAAPAILTALLLGLLLPLWQPGLPRRRVLPITSAVAGVVVLVIAVLQPAYSAEQPKWNSLMYGYDADAGQGYYATINKSLDPFLSEHIKNPEPSGFNRFYPKGITSKPFLESTAPNAQLAPAKAEVLSDTREGDVRKLRLRITSPERTLYTAVSLESNEPLTQAEVNGKSMRNEDPVPNRWEFYYFAPGDGFDVTVELKPAQQLDVRLVDARSGFPSSLDIKRPADMVPNYYSDFSFVAKTYHY